MGKAWQDEKKNHLKMELAKYTRMEARETHGIIRNEKYGKS